MCAAYMSMHTRVRIDAACESVRCLSFDDQLLKNSYRLLTCRHRPHLLSRDRGTRRNLSVGCLQTPPSNTSSVGVQSVFHVGGSSPAELPITVSNIFSFTSGSAVCGVTPQLISKFGASLNLRCPNNYINFIISRCCFTQDCDQNLLKHRLLSV